ncbi:hypothetical protein MAR_006515 [Mya arenaria]|uniref:DDE Tnp4 domain-containing protein n=1 Tax=Mya arenaria TaxID=6604 RepID=A0ABY7D9L8_MYAAR|nr:hypothetical protein MAR_006515 [Mya arenaria]
MSFEIFLQTKTNSKPEYEINENSSDEEFHPPLPKKPAFASPLSVRLNIPSTPKSHSRCFICKRPGPKLIVVPSEARFAAFVQCNVIIKSGTRWCPVHMNESLIKDEALKSVKAAESAYVNRATVLELLNKLRESCKKSNRRFDFTTLNNEEYVDLTGLSKAAFGDICYCIEGHIRNTPVRDVHTTFDISKSSIRRAITSTRQTLTEHFVPHTFGLNHISRQEVIDKHTRQLAHSLLLVTLEKAHTEPKFISRRVRITTSKAGPTACARGVIVSTTGYNRTVVVLYLSDGNNNDAKIHSHILNTNVEDLKPLLNLATYVWILEYNPRCLYFYQKVRNSFKPRIRWVVESANARLKRWKFLDRVLPNSQVPCIDDLVKIICAVCIKYLPPLSSSTDDDARQAQQMLQLVKQGNSLQAEIEEGNLEKSRAVWVPVDDTELEGFPRRTEDTLRTLTCGENLEGDEDIRVHKENSGRLQSRHISAKQYTIWLKFNTVEIHGWYLNADLGPG